MSDTIFVEGILGSGKSTLAEVLYRQNLKANVRAQFFAEHDIANPLDMTRKAVLHQSEYSRFCERCYQTATLLRKYSRSDVLSRIESRSKEFFGRRLIAYSQIYFNDPSLQRELDSLRSYEVCNGLIDKKLYLRLFSRLFQDYVRGRTEGEVHLFEGALLQNILFDLVAFYQCQYAEILAFYREIFPTIVSAQIHYIVNDDIALTLERAAQHRKASHWMEDFSAWVSHSPWGIAHSIPMAELPVAFCETIEAISCRLLRDIKGPDVHWHSCAEILALRTENGNA